MRKNHTGLGVKESVPEVAQDDVDETLVEWAIIDGQDAIRFKCLIFTNNEPKIEVMVYAIPTRDQSDG